MSRQFANMGNIHSKGGDGSDSSHSELLFCGSFSNKWNESVFLENELLTSKILSVLHPHSENRGLRMGSLQFTPRFLSANSIFASVATSLKEHPRNTLLGPDGTPSLSRNLGMTIVQRGSSPSPLSTTTGAVSKLGWVGACLDTNGLVKDPARIQGTNFAAWLQEGRTCPPLEAASFSLGIYSRCVNSDF